jgi:hypothetical protein
MANAVKPLQLGFDYQARLFWIEICRLFDSRTKVERVGYELDEVKSFDDVVIAYREPVPDHVGGLTSKDYYQAKFHLDQNGSITYQALVSPEFIGATKFSLLQKLRRAQIQHAPDGHGCRFYLVTPWAVHPDNSLSALLINDRGEINLERLFEGKTSQSKMGGVRELWRNHLELADEAELRQILRPLRIHGGHFNLEQLENLLNLSLINAGFAPFDETKRVRRYDDLTRRLHHEGLNNFTRDEIQRIAAGEGLWIGKTMMEETDRTVKIGIRSFWRFAEHLEDEVDELLSLNQYFRERHILSSELWQQNILPEVKAFVGKYVNSATPVYVILDTHGAIAFAAGRFSDTKGRGTMLPVQCGFGRQREVWSPTESGSAERLWQIEEKQLETNGNEIAIAVSVTHNIVKDVTEFVNRELIAVNRILSFEILPKPGRTSVRGGSHAYYLAEDLALRIRELQKDLQFETIHLFIAAPNGFQFHLGALSNLFGKCLLYEYDLEVNKTGAYSPALQF